MATATGEQSLEVRPASKAWSRSRPRSPSPTRRAARSATGASTSRTSSATCPFEQVWGLLVDGAFLPGLPPAEPWPLTVRTGDPRVDVQAALAHAGARMGPPAADRHLRRAGAHRPRARVGDGALVRRAVRARPRAAAGPAVGGRQGELDPRALPDPVARRGRPQAREGDRRLLDLGRRARHERVHVHGPDHRLDRRRRGRRAVGRGRRALRTAARRRPLARAADARRRSSGPATRRATSSSCSTAASG